MGQRSSAFGALGIYLKDSGAVAVHLGLTLIHTFKGLLLSTLSKAFRNLDLEDKIQIYL